MARATLYTHAHTHPHTHPPALPHPRSHPRRARSPAGTPTLVPVHPMSSRPKCFRAPTHALALAPHADRSVVGGRARSGPSCRPPGTGSLRPSPSTVPDPPTGSPRILGDPARVLSRLRPLARGQRWSGPRTYPGQVHCLDRPLAVPCVRPCGVPSPPPRRRSSGPYVLPM